MSTNHRYFQGNKSVYIAAYIEFTLSYRNMWIQELKSLVVGTPLSISEMNVHILLWLNGICWISTLCPSVCVKVKNSQNTISAK